jgi:hypothetical protein
MSQALRFLGISAAFDETATYTKHTRQLELTATVARQLIGENETTALGRSQVFDIAGAGFGHLPATGYRLMEALKLP